MYELLTIAIFYAYASAIALLSGGSRRRRITALVAATLGLAWPFHAPTENPLARAFVAVGTVWVLFRAFELAKHVHLELSGRQRVWYVVALYDTRRATRASPAVDRGCIARMAGHGALAWMAVRAAFDLAPLFHAPGFYAVRWSSALVLTYASVDAASALLIFLNRLFGVVPPPLHRDPILSRSVQEFWGERWNRIVSGFLRAHCLRPLARRRMPLAGVFAAFFVSALLHAYMTWVGVGLAMGIVMGAFFLLQFPIVVAERRFGVARWRAPAARAWTLGWLLATSPLFLEPYMRFVDPLITPG